MKTLVLTIPPVDGPDVVHAQHLLQTQGFYTSSVDGAFGPYTAAACVQAKRALGYPDTACTPVYGDTLDGYLTGRVKPSVLMGARSASRLRKARKHTTVREKAIALARTQVGVKEQPAGSNLQKYGEWYGANGVPWCAIFVTWCFVNAGSKTLKRGSRFAYVPYIVADAEHGANGLTVTKDPVPGDLVCYDWPGESPGVADHVEVFDRWDDRPQGTFITVGGNTGDGDRSNGGEVLAPQRSTGDVLCFVRITA